MMISNSLDLGGCGEDVAYPLALIECLFRSPSQLDVRTGGRQQNLTAHFAFSSLGETTYSTALPRGIRQISICVYYLNQLSSQILLASTSSHVQL